MSAKKHKFRRGLRTVRISARLSASIARARPEKLSWGEFISQLVEARRGLDPHEPDRIRVLAWAAASLDEMARIMREDVETGCDLPLEGRIHRLGGASALLTRLAELRSAIEEAIHANR